MFLQLNHQQLDVYKLARQLVKECYSVTENFPVIEKYALVQQIRRAALSVHLNIAEGCSRKSVPERKRYFEIARGSVVEIDAAFDIAADMKYFSPETNESLAALMNRCFMMLSKLLSK